MRPFCVKLVTAPHRAGNRLGRCQASAIANQRGLLLTTGAVRPTFLGTMPVTIPSAALRQMSKEERTRLLDAAFAAAPEAVAN